MMGIFVSYRVKVKLVVSLGGYVQSPFLLFIGFIDCSFTIQQYMQKPNIFFMIFTLDPQSVVTLHLPLLKHSYCDVTEKCNQYISSK